MANQTHNEQRPPAANWQALEHFGHYRSMSDIISIPESAAGMQAICALNIKRANDGILLGQSDPA